MRGRRREQRFVLSVPWEGTLRLPVDVTIESVGTQEISVLSTVPAHRNEIFTLDALDSSPSSSRRVRVKESVPVLMDGTVRHRLRLAVIGEA